jgi:DEAD/DEAH box helicase domain-containing protein
MSVNDLLKELSANPEQSSRIAHISRIPSKEPKFGDLVRPLPKDLADYLIRKGIRLYSHQCEAIEALRLGEHVILTTPTASGKTLAFNLPIFEVLGEDTRGTALYLYPTKALANDQLKSIRELEGYTGFDGKSAIYDGDTPRHLRPRIRGEAKIVLSNPFELHQILPWHYKWSRFFGGLRFIVMDEAHRYRGIFGSHIAFLLRRLLRIIHLYGGNPQFILSSATIANPDEFARKITGVSCVVIAGEGSPRGEKTFLLFNPYANGEAAESTHQASRDLLVRCVQNNLQTLCFTTSRRMAELITMWSREALGRTTGIQPDAIAAYRAGYLPQVRRSLENSIKEGRVKGVVSTNALELGIDVGTLDAVIISGFPGTMVSVWQQAGRAGRRQSSSFASLVAFQNPLDQYFMRHPDAFFSRPHEHAIIDLENPHIAAGHILCAAAEAPILPEETITLCGTYTADLIQSLANRGLLRITRSGWVYAGRGRAADALSLDSISSDTFRILCSGIVMETMDRPQAFREAHPGAVLLHLGETYIVEHLDCETRQIRVKRTEVDYYTEALRSVDVLIVAEREHRQIDGVDLFYGDVEVVEHYYAYRTKRYDTVIATDGLDLPPIRFTTRAVWFKLPDHLAGILKRSHHDFAAGLHAAEHALIGMMPFHVLCDRWDIGGFSAPWFPDTDSPTILIYDGHEGGAGIAEKGYELLPFIIGTAYELVRDCGCSSGCPACILSPKCGNDNQPLDKEAARYILEELNRLLNPQEKPDAGE